MSDGKIDTSAGLEIAAGDRFAFGENWKKFVGVIDDARIEQARISLLQMLDDVGPEDLRGKRFLDVGSGSGLMSLAAKRLGMRVVSFDFDGTSVACTTELRKKYCEADPTWTVTQGSVLDKCFLSGLGTFDFVYAWGVLHHTGDMWGALGNLIPLVAEKGSLMVALYNDQGFWSKVWRIIKRAYNKMPSYLKPLFVVLVMAPRELKIVAVPILKGRFRFVTRLWRDYARSSGRGMSRWHDMVDWVGGYPFEVSKPEDVFQFLKLRGFSLMTLKTCAGELGCNEYVFTRK